MIPPGKKSFAWEMKSAEDIVRVKKSPIEAVI